jgi:hypothetical protein
MNSTAKVRKKNELTKFFTMKTDKKSKIDNFFGEATFTVFVIIVIVAGLLKIFSAIPNLLGIEKFSAAQISNVLYSIIATVAILTLVLQSSANKENRKNIAREKLDGKFYELLRMHRQNIEEMKIGTLEKRQVFKELFYEFCNCQILVNNILEKLKTENFGNDELQEFCTKFGQEKKLNIAYQLFFYGGEFSNVSKLIYANVDVLHTEKNSLIEKITDEIKKTNTKWQQGNFSITEDQWHLDNKIVSFYKPYCGHSEWLGHYYRHLYQTVNFINKEAILSEEEKYEYIKILKAQLSEYEQALLFYHAISDFGSVWFEGGKDSLIVNYRLIQNMPLLIVYGGECDVLNKKLSKFLSSNEIKQYFENE